MKKSLILIISILAIMGMTSSVYAANYTNSANSNLTIGASSEIECEISPGVLANVGTTANTYGIVTVNTKADTDAIGYNVHSASGAIFMKAYSATPTAADAASPGAASTGYSSK